MKHLRLVLWVAMLSVAVLAGMSSVAQADLVLINPGDPANSFVDLGAQGFGNAPRLLTLQGPIPPQAHSANFEVGNETPINVENGDAVDGADKSTTPTLATLGWITGANVGIGFNAAQSGGTGITMNSLTLTLYNGTTAVGSFNLGAPVPLQFSAADLALQPGNGNAVFDFHLTAAEQAQFNTLVGTFGTGLFAGVGSDLGCHSTPSATCQVSNDGPDTFVGFVQAGQRVVPEPGTLLLLGSGLVGVVVLTARRRA
jgi:hypothetical protein